MTTAILKLKSRALAHAPHGKGPFLQSLVLPLKLTYVFAGLCALVLVVFYIWQINALTQGAFLIKNYNKEMSSLLTDNKELQADVAQSEFLDQAQTYARELDFQKTTQIQYIKIVDTSLAQAR